MKKKFTFLMAALMLLTIFASPLGMLADEASYVFNTDAGIAALGITKPSSGSGTSLSTTTPYSVGQISMSVTHGSTDTRVWNSSGTLDLRIYKSGGSLTFSAASGYNITGITITGNTVANFSANVGTFSNGSWSNSTTGSSSVTLTATNTGKINTITVTYSSTGGSLTPSNLALTGAPVALSFDLYNNSAAQTVSYTTSSTGSVTVSNSDYITTSVNTENKTITVTPIAVTPSTQTITVNQAADATYAAGSVTFTVTISDSTPIPTHTVTYSVNGSTTTKDFEEGATITFPDNPVISGMTFVGWVTTTIDGTTDEAPTFVTSATMGNGDVTYYAVFADVTGTTPASWTATQIGNISSSDVFVIATGTKAMSNNNGTNSAPSAISITVSGTTLTSTITDNIKWNVSGNATDGYTFYPNGSTTTWLFCNTTAGSSNNNNIRVGDGNRKVWEFDGSGYLVTNDNYSDRYLSLYSDSEFRGYLNTNNGAFAPIFYKYIASSTTYANYCTTVYTLTYAGNGANSGNVPAAPTAYSPGATVTVLGNTGNLAKTGYVFEEWNTVSNGSSGSSYEAGDEFAITQNTTLYAQWIADENEYEIKTSATNGSVTVKVGGSEVTTAPTGETVTLEVAPTNINYVLYSLTVTQGDDPVALSPGFDPSIHTYTFTMPAGDVNVSASFKIAWTVQFSVNGTVNNLWTRVKDNNAEIGELPTPANSDIPEGFTFKGWTASTQYYHASDAPTMITASTPITNSITYAAVFAEAYEGSSLTTATLTESEITTNITNTTCAYGTEKSYNDTGDGIKWTASCYTDAASRKWMQLKNDNTAYIKIEASDNIKRLDVTITSAQNASQGINDITKHDAFSNSGTISLRTASNGGDVVGSTSGSSIDNNVATINTTVNKTTVYLKVSTGARVWGITVKCAPTEYKNYTTLVTDQSISGNTTGETRIFGEIAATAGFTNNGTITIYDGGVLNMGNYKLTNTDATKLIIEDGGQLIVHNTGVQATIKKTVSVPSKTATNWYTIASPVRNVNIGPVDDAGSVNNLKAAGGEYDLYRFNETKDDVGTNLRWENYKNSAYHDGGADDFTSLESGRGYLYRREGTATLEYVGEVNGSEYETYALTIAGAAPLTGFHLIGNPYSHDIYKGAGAAIDDSKLNEGFYRLTNGTAWTPVYGYKEPIHSGEGILVQANDGGTLTISNSTTSASGESKYNNDNIMFSVSNSQHEDVAYAVFDKGHGLNKIEHRDANIPMLYISQNGEDYAIAMMSDDTKTFGLSLKAATMGQYTLKLKANGNYTYLHVIDRLTGEDVDMLLEDEYIFVASANDIRERFIVKLGYMPDYSDAENDVIAYQSGDQILVSGEGELQIFDVTSRKVMTTTINGVEAIKGLNNGVYIFKLEGKTQKIVVR